VDVVGKLNDVPEHIGPIGVKSGVINGLTVTLIVCGLAQGNRIESGVNT
jgi:hypothetical protein